MGSSESFWWDRFSRGLWHTLVASAGPCGYEREKKASKAQYPHDWKPQISCVAISKRQRISCLYRRSPVCKIIIGRLISSYSQNHLISRSQRFKRHALKPVSQRLLTLFIILKAQSTLYPTLLRTRNEFDFG